MVNLHYKIPPGFLWNLSQKITTQTGLSKEEIGITSSQIGVSINIFKDITKEQNKIIDNIMINNPFEIPFNPNLTTFKIMDIWGMRQKFFKGLPYKPLYWFEQEKEDGSGECYIYLQFPKKLTFDEKTQVINTYHVSIEEVK